jgi:hypothetical protein
MIKDVANRNQKSLMKKLVLYNYFNRILKIKNYI